MNIRRLFIAAAISAFTGAFTTGASATPLTSGAGSELKSATAPGVEKAAYRRCWWRNGYRVCRWVGGPYYDDGYYGDGYYGYGPYFGFGPGIGFGFGGGHGGHFHGGGHGHHR
jgi:hypothetical protein